MMHWRKTNGSDSRTGYVVAAAIGLILAVLVTVVLIHTFGSA
jgi:hypothetical protein